MEFSEDVLKRVMQESLGIDVYPVTMLLNENEELSELKLASIMNVEVNEARRLLYKLYQENLVSFKKKKDEESGWYTYYWKLDDRKMNTMIRTVCKKTVSKISSRLTNEMSNQFFFCNDRCVRLTQDEALLSGFKCPECGQVLTLEDNSRRIEILQGSLSEIKEIFKNQLNS